MSARADLRIRLARPEERDTLEALQWRASLANDKDRPHLDANPDAIHLPRHQIERDQVFVAELDGRAVGFSSIVTDDGHLELDGLFVEPDLWRRGIGAALVEFTVHEARRQGMAVMVVANPAAREFYEKCGFTVEGEADTRFGPALRMSR